METIRGRVWKFGDDVNTDVIAPGKYLKLPNDEMAKHVFEGIDPELPEKIKPGDIVVGGANFGSGSSRESAPAAIKYAGVSAVVAVFFARIFFRNAINLGLPVLECPESDKIQQGDELEIDLVNGTIRNLTRGEVYQASRLPEHIQELIKVGGLVPHLEQELEDR
ncbi:3-isopropylmalate dehydratase small subunit [Paradesulfitobacterium ferrireducens]|uniref:3-isopropylmalate dehydratase small subunit n=1 Tax=Paradesulfitobacterium ferrireducens TaxID=2816476 RepID=UPI001A8FD3C8|nr:3-isopropylmalate dehydratase small subunit [Paradesulfitobacterium ferrireducens]